jgi:uncharacterized protein YjbI with pentapeptide repeats
VESLCSGARVLIADESTCLMTVQSAAGIADAAGAELAGADLAGAELAGAELAEADALVVDAAGALVELELLQAASAAHIPPATNSVRAGLVTVNISVSSGERCSAHARSA